MQIQDSQSSFAQIVLMPMMEIRDHACHEKAPTAHLCSFLLKPLLFWKYKRAIYCKACRSPGRQKVPSGEWLAVDTKTSITEELTGE